ncbi:CAIB/BAIF family enzyme [Coniochaeta hoffmannii]|uniref:CAIB/BAIF family enzyme n=1 Tax=Coniochaeta hoffmannii TaxID=91930 RepID=A0AA38R687_9PEZI|nr:CAIB/BAIF family enzyme [Coniochaeta hoffmannii]
MSRSAKSKEELRIFTPIGQLGQGFNDDIFWETVESGVDAIIADGGSTDSGPGRLGLGLPNVPWSRLARDLETFAKAAHLYHVPALIGSIGGDGENAHVDTAAEIIAAAVKKNGYRPLKIIKIYAEIPKDLVRQKLDNGLIGPCGGGVPGLTEDDIASSTRIVAQMGLEPYLKAMRENPDFDIIIGGRSYDPAPYAALCVYKGFEDLGVNYAMGKIMECGAQCSIPKSKEGLAILRKDSFDMIPLDPKSKCTTVSVASHFLYEKTRPDILHGPGGALHLDQTTYEQLDDRSVRVRNAKFVPEPEGEYTVKLEGAKVNGYHTIFLGALRDPILLQQFDSWIERIRAYVDERMDGLGFEYDLKIHRYGVDGVMGPLEPDHSVGKEVFIAGQARAPTQDQADQVAGMAKFAFTHAPYPGQLATAGNFAWPFTPCEIPMGPLPEFCVYHIMRKVDPIALFPFSVIDAHGDNTYVHQPRVPKLAVVKAGGTKIKTLQPPRNYWLTPEPAAGTCYLADVASVLRSKNSGPYELTFDVMFPNQEIYDRVKKDVIASLFFDQAMAYKATIARPAVSGGFGEIDTHGSQQHIPLMYLTLPFGRD